MTTAAADSAAEEPGTGPPDAANAPAPIGAIPSGRESDAAPGHAESKPEAGPLDIDNASTPTGTSPSGDNSNIAPTDSADKLGHTDTKPGAKPLDATNTPTPTGTSPSSGESDAAPADGESASGRGERALPRGEGKGGEEKPRRARGEQTRQLILETALRLFRERGYTETTMRAIAKEAGVAVGNAYYYFDSKEHLIQGFYDRNQAAHRVAAEAVLANEKDFAARLRGVLHAGIDVNEPYHSFAATFFKTAAEPSSPLSPFSRESSPAREAAIAIFRDVVDGSSAKLDPELRKELPELLWLGWMGVVLFWVYDRSPGQRRTRRLIDGVVPLMDRLVGLSRLRVLRPALRQILALLDTIRRDD